MCWAGLPRIHMDAPLTIFPQAHPSVGVLPYPKRQRPGIDTIGDSQSPKTIHSLQGIAVSLMGVGWVVRVATPS